MTLYIWTVHIKTVKAGQKLTLHWEGASYDVFEAIHKALAWCAEHSCDQLAEVIGVVRVAEAAS